MTIEIRDPPTIVRRPEAEYQRNVGGKVTMPCQAAGPPKVSISWRRVSLPFGLHVLGCQITNEIIDEPYELRFASLCSRLTAEACQRNVLSYSMEN